jgi:anti-anti-sigma regulatory factor
MFSLPADLGLDAAAALKASLQEEMASGGAIVVQADAVEKITTPCVQILLAACLESARQQRDFRLDNPSDTLRRALGDLGIAHFFDKQQEHCA